MSNQQTLSFGMQVMEASLSPLPSVCRILKFDNLADAVTFSQTINLEWDRKSQAVLAFSRREAGGEFIQLGSLADKRDQREVWLRNPMCGMYSVKFEGEIIGESVTIEQADEDAEAAWAQIEMEEWIEMKNYRPPTPPSP